LVLEEAEGRPETELALATGQKSSAVQAVVRSFRRLGLMGLVDAPRSGRPLTADKSNLVANARNSSARAAAVAEKVSRDVVWRQARLEGLSIERSTGRIRPVPAYPSMPRVVGLYSDDTTAVLLSASHEAIDEWVSPIGGCRSSERGRVVAAAGVANKDWKEALTELRDRPGGVPERARSEAKAWFAQRAGKVVAVGCDLTALVCGDPTSKDFIRWLGVLRTLVPPGVATRSSLRLRCVTNFAQWSHALDQQGLPPGVTDGLLWPVADARPFTWCRNARSARAAVDR